MKGKIGAGFEDLGEQILKNIAEPIQVFRVVAKSGPLGRASLQPRKLQIQSFRRLGGVASTCGLRSTDDGVLLTSSRLSDNAVSADGAFEVGDKRLGHDGASWA